MASYLPKFSPGEICQNKFRKTNLAGCSIYEISARDLRLSKTTKQKILLITPSDQLAIMINDIVVAQFIYLILKNEKVRSVIDTMTSKAVLILGRFTDERKVVLDVIRGGLRARDYLPILFDFEKPISRDLTESISTLAHMPRSIIADVMDARRIRQELQVIVPVLPYVPVRLLFQKDAREHRKIGHFKRYPWVIETYAYLDNAQP